MDAHRTAELERARQETEGLSWQQQSWSGWPVLLRMLKPNLPLSLQLLPEHSVKMKTVKNYFDTLSSDSFDWGWEGIFNSISLTQSRFTTTGLWRCFLFYTKHLALVWRKKSFLRPTPGSGRGTAIRGEGKQKKKTPHDCEERKMDLEEKWPCERSKWWVRVTWFALTVRCCVQNICFYKKCFICCVVP